MILLQLVHSSKLDDFNKACKNQCDKIKKAESYTEQRKMSIFGKGNITKTAFDQAVLKLIVNTASPYTLVEHNAFIEFCELMIKQKPITRKTLVSNLVEAYTKIAQLIETFEKLECVSVTAPR